jgi:oligogalacturonide lyase
MGRTWPSEKKIVPEPVTGLPLTFLTSTDGGYSQSKIYQTHRQWTSDGKWLIFRGVRETGPQAMAVNAETGQIVQLTESGFMGMLCAANKTMKLYVMSGGGGARGPSGPRQILEIDLAKLFADVAAGSVKPAANYQRIRGTIPASLPGDGNMGLDVNDDFIYFRVGGPRTAPRSYEAVIGKDEVVFAMCENGRLIPGTGQEPNYASAGTWEKPTGVGVINLRTRQMRIAGQVPLWSGGRSDWHVAGSGDGRWAASDDFKYEVWLYDRHNGETTMLAGPQNVGADHIHPMFNAEGTKIEVQSALISKDAAAQERTQSDV